jgi:hypothetical protein
MNSYLKKAGHATDRLEEVQKILQGFVTKQIFIERIHEISPVT